VQTTSSFETIDGQQFKNFTLTAELQTFTSVTQEKIRIVEAQCLCGKTHTVQLQHLLKNKFKCRCPVEQVFRKLKWRKPKAKVKPRPRKDYTFQKFGKLFILANLEDRVSPNGNKYRMVQVECDCGNTKAMLLSSILQGTQSCGCLRRSYKQNSGKQKPSHNLIRIEY
jgi:hypothetical protein